MREELMRDCGLLERYVQNKYIDAERSCYPEGSSYLDTTGALEDFRIRMEALPGAEPQELTEAMEELADKLMYADRAQELLPAVGEMIVRLLKLCTDRGSASAMYRLGMLYLEGRLGEPDYEQARSWLEQASDNLYVLAPTRLGMLYVNGTGVERDEAKAFSLFTMAVSLGDDEAMFRLGDLYRTGGFVPQNLRMAARLYKIAYFRKPPKDRRLWVGGCKSARVGDIFYEGLGEERNDFYALQLYEEAQWKLSRQILQGDSENAPLLDTVSRRIDALRMRWRNSPDHEPKPVQ